MTTGATGGRVGLGLDFFRQFYETVKVAKTDIEGNLSVLVEGL